MHALVVTAQFLFVINLSYSLVCFSVGEALKCTADTMST